ncbi:GNAT family N-acetyltransferase [Streptomyces sp. NPDC058284]|uniref:GNAT family N-acetyltransferase n=1 Tax=unclassified Streptomyces TaxID=2593676 RepID=UPI003668CD03
MTTARLTVRPATDDDIDTLVSLYEGAARWMAERGIAQWQPGAKDERHFRRLIGCDCAQVWLADDGDEGNAAGAYELWWSDEQAWGVQPPVAGYVHRLMTRRGAPSGTGRELLRDAERRIAAAGRGLARLDCVTSNPRLRTYYEEAGYTVVGELRDKRAADGGSYGVLLLERPLGP